MTVLVWRMQQSERAVGELYELWLHDCNIEFFLSRSMTVKHLGPSLKTEANSFHGFRRGAL
jgi:hypothetical protein